MILDGKVDSSDRWMVGGHWTTGRDEGGMQEEPNLRRKGGQLVQ